MAFFFLPGKGENTAGWRLKNCAPLSGEEGEVLYLHEGFAFFFFFFKISKQPQLASGNSAARSGILKLSAGDFLKCRMLQERVGGEGCQVQCII